MKLHWIHIAPGIDWANIVVYEYRPQLDLRQAGDALTFSTMLSDACFILFSFLFVREENYRTSTVRYLLVMHALIRYTSNPLWDCPIHSGHLLVMITVP